MTRVALGLGSNVPPRARTLKRAVVALVHGPEPVVHGARLARTYVSPAVLPPGAPESWDRPYLNTVLLGETTLEPGALLARLKALETRLGRRPAERWAPRPVDLDVLWWGGGAVERPELTVPHPELTRRSFVLEPLRDLLPDLTVEGRTVAEHAARRRREEAEPAVVDPEADLRVRYPLLMGILNVTPDSFSDGGLHLDPEAALARARSMARSGAWIVDVGGESTRPDGRPVRPEEEWARLEPVLLGLAALRREGRIRLSLDTRHVEVARRGLGKGVDLLNDVAGFRDPAMRAVAAEAEVEAVFMHSASVPVVPGERLPEDRDPVAVVREWGRARARELEEAGVERGRLHLDPGIGFGKSADQSWRLLEGIEGLHALGLPLVVGHSRKSFLGSPAGLPARERDEATVRVSLALARTGVEVLRVHDPALHARRFRADLLARGETWLPVGPQSSSLTRPSSRE